MAETDRGWAFIGGARKAHYYDSDNRSLCGRYVAFAAPDAAFESDNGPSSDDCAGCRKKLDARKP